VDFRKGAEGLAALVRDVMGADPFDGAVYVFGAKRADRVKLVYWDGTGVCLFAKRLEDGRFQWPQIASRPARTPRPTDRSLRRLQCADDRSHHCGLGVVPDPNARSRDVQFNDRGTRIRRFALDALRWRRHSNRRLDDHRSKRQGAGPLVGLSTRLAAPVEQLLRRQAMAARDVANQRAILKALRDDRRLLLSRPGSPLETTADRYASDRPRP
jgi:hypothetical protein